MSFDAVVLAGGAATRLGGIDKASITIDGVTLLERVLAAAGDAGRIICVGPERTTPVPVDWTVEEPARGGPVAAIAAGLTLVDAPVVVVLAVDLPFVTRSVVARLVAACPSEGAALVVDEDGVPQPLLAAYATDVLERRLTEVGDPAGVAVKRVVEGIPYELVKAPGVSRDLDTWSAISLAQSEPGL